MFLIDHLLDFIQVGPDHLLGVKGAPREDDLTLATTLARHRPHQRRPHDQDFVVVDVLAHRWYTGTGGVVAASRSSLYQMVLLHHHHHHHHHQLELGREFFVNTFKGERRHGDYKFHRNGAHQRKRSVSIQVAKKLRTIIWEDRFF